MLNKCVWYSSKSIPTLYLQIVRFKIKLFTICCNFWIFAEVIGYCINWIDSWAELGLKIGEGAGPLASQWVRRLEPNGLIEVYATW